MSLRLLPSHRRVVSLLLLIFFPLPPSLADVGTAASYGPPYIPTECYGSDESQFPADQLFAAAGEGIWDNGASCGRRYAVRCLSAAIPDVCNTAGTVEVVILDRASSLPSAPSASGTTMVLSESAFGMLLAVAAKSNFVNQINIEFAQV